VSPGSFLTVCDDKSGYDHVFLTQDSRTYFGFQWAGWFFTSIADKKRKFLSLVRHILHSGSADVKTLQRLSGKCISFSLAIPAAHLFLNDINIAIGKGIQRSQPWSYVKPLAAPGSMLCLMTTKSYR